MITSLETVRSTVRRHWHRSHVDYDTVTERAAAELCLPLEAVHSAMQTLGEQAACDRASAQCGQCGMGGGAHKLQCSSRANERPVFTATKNGSAA